MPIRYFVVLTVFMAASATAFSQGSGLLKALEPQGSAADQARENGYQVVRVLPRGLFPEESDVFRGGGAYFSFAKNSHNYNDTPQLSLELNKLHVGFAGTDYGMITRLGSVSLEKVNEDLIEVKVLVAYRPAKTEPEARAEYQRLNVDPSKALWSKNANVVVGSTYLLRAVNYGEADTAVAFQVLSQEPDGGVTIAWKKISEFDKPILKRVAKR